MARARNIKPGFFRNEDLAELDPLARLLFIGLWTIADREGRLEDRPKRIRAEVLPYDDGSVDSMLQSLHESGFILRYESGGVRYIQVVNFAKHQNPHVKESASLIPAPDKHCASTVQAPDEHGSSPADSLIPDSPSLIPETGGVARAVPSSTVVAPDPSEPLALPAPPVEAISEDPQAPTTTRQGAICQQLRAGGMSDAAPSYLDPDTWERILALRTDGEIVELALAKMRDRPGKRTGLKYVAPILLDPPQRIAGPPAGARASPVSKATALAEHNRQAAGEAKRLIFGE